MRRPNLDSATTVLNLQIHRPPHTKQKKETAPSAILHNRNQAKWSARAGAGFVHLPHGLAAAGGHDDQAVPPLHDRIHDLPLVRPEPRVPEVPLRPEKKNPGLEWRASGPRV